MDFDTNALARTVDLLYPTLSTAQKHAFDIVMSSVRNDEGRLYCLNASGGTGKTYLLNVIIDAEPAQHKIVLATALSGIAGTLLHNGHTLHSCCKIPLNLNEYSTYQISNNASTAKLLRLAKMLIINEVSMGHRYLFECLNRSLQDIRKNSHLFGGITVLFAGDWKQLLPVV